MPNSERPIYFHLPASFNSREALPNRLRNRGDDARWLLNAVVTRTAFGDTDEYGYVHMNSNIMKKVMSKRTYAEVTRALVDEQWFDPPTPHSASRWSKGYRISGEHQAEPLKLVEAKNEGIITRIRREWDRVRQEQKKLWLPIYHKLARAQNNLTILPSADVILDSLKPQALLCQSILIHDIRTQNYKFTLGHTGRAYNSITGLIRVLRKSLRLSGEPLGGVDIRCAQPGLLVVLMQISEGKNVPTYIHTLLGRVPPLDAAVRRYSGLIGLDRAVSGSAPGLESDFNRFKDLIDDGSLYEEFISICQAGGVILPDSEHPMRWSKKNRGSPPDNPRDGVKLYFLRDVLAKCGNYPSHFERVFRDAFPSVHGFVRWINQNDYCNLIRTLQRLESWLVIENVAPRLVDRIPIVTLHDAIYGRRRDMPIVQDAFYETFEALGIQLKVKAE
jgi:hypothetical protein